MARTAVLVRRPLRARSGRSQPSPPTRRRRGLAAWLAVGAAAGAAVRVAALGVSRRRVVLREADGAAVGPAPAINPARFAAARARPGLGGLAGGRARRRRHDAAPGARGRGVVAGGCRSHGRRAARRLWRPRSGRPERRRGVRLLVRRRACASGLRRGTCSARHRDDLRRHDAATSPPGGGSPCPRRAPRSSSRVRDLRLWPFVGALVVFELWVGFVAGRAAGAPLAACGRGDAGVRAGTGGRRGGFARRGGRRPSRSSRPGAPRTPR